MKQAEWLHKASPASEAKVKGSPFEEDAWKWIRIM
jgi:hypothetical protein